jgi:arsenite transporter
MIVPKENMAEAIAINPAKASGGFGTFERYLSVWVALCMVTGIGLGKLLPGAITGRFSHVVLIAVPITLQVYLNAGFAYGLMKWLKVEHSVAAPGALIGASNFFELAVATATALFGPQSGAALATVVGVLVEVPVMLSVCAACNRTRHWFPAEQVR